MLISAKVIVIDKSQLVLVHTLLCLSYGSLLEQVLFSRKLWNILLWIVFHFVCQLLFTYVTECQMYFAKVWLIGYFLLLLKLEALVVIAYYVRHFLYVHDSWILTSICLRLFAQKFIQNYTCEPWTLSGLSKR